MIPEDRLIDDAAPFTAVAPADVLGGDGMVPCRVAERDLLLCRHAGRWYAVAARCSHAGASLAGGRLARGKIVCPLHGAAFDLATGAPLSPPAFRPIATFAARERNGRIEVAV